MFHTTKGTVQWAEKWWIKHTWMLLIEDNLQFWLINYSSPDLLIAENRNIAARWFAGCDQFHFAPGHHFARAYLPRIHQWQEKRTLQSRVLLNNWHRWWNLAWQFNQCSFRVSFNWDRCLFTHSWQITSSQCGQTNNSVFVEHNAHLATINNGLGLPVILKDLQRNLVKHLFPHAMNHSLEFWHFRDRMVEIRKAYSSLRKIQRGDSFSPRRPKIWKMDFSWSR